MRGAGRDGDDMNGWELICLELYTALSAIELDHWSVRIDLDVWWAFRWMGALGRPG